VESAILDIAPETPGEELRFDSALRAVHIHESARAFRTIVIVVVFAMTAVRIGLATSIGLPKGLVDPVVLYTICLLASWLAFSFEWSTRLDRENRLQNYARYLLSHRAST
jgi:hypothetical protein